MLQLLASVAVAQGFGVQVLVLEGDPAPGTGGGVFDRLVSVDLDDSGGVVFNATVTGGTAAQGVFLVEDDLIVLATPPPTVPSSGPLGILAVTALLAASAGLLLRQRRTDLIVPSRRRRVS